MIELECEGQGQLHLQVLGSCAEEVTPMLTRPAAVCLALLLGLSLGSCRQPALEIGPPGGTIETHFLEIEIDSGFGLDRNGNEISDIPNTSAYVQRPLRATLDFSFPASLMPSVWPVPAGSSPGLGNRNGPWRWTLTPVDVPQDETTLPAPPSTYAGVSGANNAGTLVAYTQTPVLEIDLFEGAWRVEFARMSASDPTGAPIYWLYADINVEDWLIVQLGDSYSSGEGAPERESTHGIWADDGSAEHPRNPNYRSSCFGGSPIPPVFTAAQVECMRQQAYGSVQNFQHELAHRSSKAWGSLVAMEVESWSKSSSVTFVNLAATGAQLRHLTQPQTDLPTVVMPGIIPLGPGLNPFGPRRRMAAAVMGSLPAQLSELETLAGQRPVDAVFMSFGGNDAGFSNAIVAYLIRDEGENEFLPIIEAAINDGNWAPVGQHTFEARNSGHNFPSNLPGLNGLPAAFLETFDALRGAGIAANNVYIIEYPDPLVASTDHEKGSHGDDEVEVCPDPILTAVPEGTFLGIAVHDPKMGRVEQRHARGHFIHPLNNQIAQAAQTHGWNLVGQIMESMYRRPICESSRMVRLFKQSLDVQGDDRGTLHPNELGHQQIAAIVAAHVHMPNAHRNQTEYTDALRAAGQEYPADPRHRLYRWENYTGSPARRAWLSVGLGYTSSRAFIEVSPALCSGGALAIDAQAPHDYLLSNRRVVLEPWRIGNAVLRLFRREPGGATEVARLSGFGTLTYSPTDADRGKEFFLVASTARNEATEPSRFARVHGGPTMSDEYGTFEIRVRCP